MFDNRKEFVEPEVEIIKMLVADVITTSGDNPGGDNPGGGNNEEDWGMGEF